jgi:hypothetical protein
MPTAALRVAEDDQQLKRLVEAWLKTCLEDWDQATHMSKDQWKDTCQRLAAERGRFRVEHPSTVGDREYPKLSR